MAVHHQKQLRGISSYLLPSKVIFLSRNVPRSLNPPWSLPRPMLSSEIIPELTLKPLQVGHRAMLSCSGLCPCSRYPCFPNVSLVIPLWLSKKLNMFYMGLLLLFQVNSKPDLSNSISSLIWGPNTRKGAFVQWSCPDVPAQCGTSCLADMLSLIFTISFA